MCQEMFILYHILEQSEIVTQSNAIYHIYLHLVIVISLVSKAI